MQKGTRKKYFSVLIFGLVFASIVPLAIALFGILSPGQVMADTTTASVTVGNTRPTSGATALTDDDPTPADDNIEQSYGDTPVQVTCSAVITDLNGCSEVTDAEAVFYTSVGENEGNSCSADPDNCYRATQTLGTCVQSVVGGETCEGGLDTTVTYKCTKTFEFAADRTDAGTEASKTWKCAMRAKDGDATWGGWIGVASRDANELLTFRALSVNASLPQVDFTGMIPEPPYSWALGENTGSTPAVLGIDATGNAEIDVDVDATAMTCSGGFSFGSIPAANLKADGSLTAYGTSTNTLDTTRSIDMSFSPSGDPDYGTVPMGSLYYGLGVPAQDVAGSCSGTTTITATATL